MAASDKKSVLFICLGNICRSPIAEAVFAHLVNEKGLTDKWSIDSAATSGWEVGSGPDGRAQNLLKRNGVAMKHIARQWHIDSGAMMSWHTGNRPDERGLACLKKHGIQTNHRARKVTKSDFKTFDIIFGMDKENMSDLKAMSPSDATAKVILLGTYDPQKQLIIEDPYYGGDAGFETVYEQCVRCCKAFLEEQS